MSSESVRRAKKKQQFIPNAPSVAAHEAAKSIGNYCSTRFQVAGTDNDVHPMLDIPWFADAIEKECVAPLRLENAGLQITIDSQQIVIEQLQKQVAGLKEGITKATCVPNGFGLCSTHPCDYHRGTVEEYQAENAKIKSQWLKETAALNELVKTLMARLEGKVAAAKCPCPCHCD